MILYSHEKVIKNFRSLLREKRELLGLSQSEVASKIALKQAHYSLIERGERNISMLQMLELAAALEIDLEAFFRTQAFPKKRERKTKRLQLVLRESSVDKLGALAEQMQTSKNNLVQNLVDVFAVFCDNLVEQT